MKTPNLTAAIPIRIDAATAANVESIIASGMGFSILVGSSLWCN